MAKLIDATYLILSSNIENNRIHVKDIVDSPAINPVHAANACYCKECQYYESFRDYPDCSKILTYGYCYYWKYEEGESPNEVDENDFCSRGIKGNSKNA